jgi:eukaryotic-like serine/threonine-protein kinase
VRSRELARDASVSFIEAVDGMIMLRDLQASDPRYIGPYRLRGLLGVGGMGRVYLGQSAEGPLVAVKVIRADLVTDPEFLARFRREVTVARRVSSQFTATVVGADTVT